MGEEAKIEAAVSKYARSRGMLVRKFTSPAHRAVPDKYFLMPNGQSFFIEFKAPNKKPTPLQEREIALIRKNKGVVFVIDDKQGGLDLIKKLEKFFDSQQTLFYDCYDAGLLP